MAMDEQKGGSTISQINVTPLVDVMLVLLVIFMVTAPILQQGVSVDLPQVKAGSLTGDEEQLVVAITQTGEIFLNDNKISAEQLEKKLRAIMQMRSGRQVYIRADRNVAYGEVMRVMAAIREAGVQRLGMVTEPLTQAR